MASSEASGCKSELSPLLPSASAPENHGSCTDSSAIALEDDAKNGIAKPFHREFAKDVVDTIHLALPIFISRVSYVGMKTTDTALLGHVSGQALSAAALSDLWTMCTGVLLQGRILGILVGQSIGAQNHQIALVYLRISYIILGLLSVVVMISWGYTQKVWEALGQSTVLAKDAGYYSSVFIFMVPAQIGFDQLAQFFSAQRIMKPEVVTALMALIVNLMLGLVFVLGMPLPRFDGYGFVACPIVTVVVDWFQLIILSTYFNWFLKSDQVWRNIMREVSFAPVEATSSSRSQWNQLFTSLLDGITKKRITTFSRLYFPAALSLSSDFWRMGVIGAMAASIGEREVGLFNASYRILWITLIFVGALSGASGIKVGLRLGNGNAMGARQAALVGLLLSILLVSVLSILVYFNSRAFGMVFTNDESYLDLFEECRLPFCCALFFMNLAVAIETIPINMGRTGIVFYAGFIASWLGQVPGVYFLTHFWSKDLYALYTGIAVGYFLLVFLYGAIVYSSDWQKYAELAMERAEVKSKPGNSNK
ncbi:hypothetical protein HJC23_005151 [Cyclotella cryptica]|uniref:Multidrug and toxic compound extrusion protein n=1 Tax=Cyclotella cryptica TaxID=29204 RepID=A0ABD3QFT0_9STRA|eukprot:CCRYP_005847-RA/>CCRYP_005847-RA protein AED:0.24 eAED:0.24 QI:216/1/1/1/1/1/4/1017/536